jgi:hypothetical protein
MTVAPGAALDAVLGMTAALSAAAAGEEEDKAAIRAEGSDKRFSDPKNLNEEKKNGAAIPPVRSASCWTFSLVAHSSARTMRCAPLVHSCTCSDPNKPPCVQWVHARIGMSRLGVGADARGVPLKDAVEDGTTLNLSLIDRGSLTFTVRAT